jgi:tetratricopeptide (TPR) repeat protein
MTVLLWILGVLALPVVIAAVWFTGVFVKELFRPSPPDPDEAARAAEERGLLPAERQDTEHPAPLPAAWSAALDAVRGGAWQPAAELLSAVGRDWERRSTAVALLATLAAREDGWLMDWEAARPADPDAAVVRAQSTVYLAWELRGAKGARHTTREQFEGFHRTLAAAREEIAKAAELNPDDPTPHIAEIWVALGLGYPHAEMDKLWAEITTRAPYHYGAHFAALQYWCEKWRGSEQLAFDFAERAAAEAPLGSLLTVLPLIAHFEHDESTDVAADNTPEMVARVDAALADAAEAAAAGPDRPGLAQLRHLLAFYLHLQDRHEAALEQFHLIDGYVDALPWSYRGDDAAAYYCRVRNETVGAVAGAV